MCKPPSLAVSFSLQAQCLYGEVQHIGSFGMAFSILDDEEFKFEHIGIFYG